MNIHAKIANAIPPEIMVVCGLTGVLLMQVYVGLAYPDIDILQLVRNPFVLQPAVMAIPFEIAVALDIIGFVSYALIAYPLISHVFKWCLE